jgi:hypothetical protein
MLRLVAVYVNIRVEADRVAVVQQYRDAPLPGTAAGRGDVCFGNVPRQHGALLLD